jgi:hypothetical protein
VFRLLVVVPASLFLAACTPTAHVDDASARTSVTGAPANATTLPRNPTRDAYFGDLHVHTKYSFDAFAYGTTADPDAAYAFARGGALTHPAGFEMKLDRPLDFQAVTDHAMYLGMLPAMLDPDSPAYRHPEAARLRAARTPEERRGVSVALNPYLSGAPGTRQHLDEGVVRDAWLAIIESANRNNDPGRFTAFVGYEYTSDGGERNNLHRNVIFRGDRGPPLPFSRLDSKNPEDLWARMDAWRAEGMDALAIPHNSNGSGGRMFEREYYDGGAIDDAYAKLRMRNEPVVEIAQIKGSSEAHPALATNDEWADFEIMPYKVSTTILSAPAGSYVRDAYRRGLEIADTGIGNPYRFGVIGSSDTHVAAGSFEEDNYWAKVGLLDATPALRGSVPGEGKVTSVGDPKQSSDARMRTQDGSGRTYRDTTYPTFGTAGLAGIWAESNTREDLFDALRRKETFGTSGPRIRVRFFGGRDIAALRLDSADLVADAYAKGVPMGGDLFGDATTMPPSFLVWAMRDPLEAPLQRVQVIKGWMQDGRSHERVYDVACSDGLTVEPGRHRCPDNGARVDPNTCAISADVGDDEIVTVWTDPDFDGAQRAFYYVRVLQNPTCRWSTWDAIRTGVAPRRDFPTTLQERAWSSPIWYTPA